MPNTTKKCSKCGEVLGLDRFSPGASRCKKCKSQYLVEKYRTNAKWREKVKAYHRKHERKRRRDPEKNARMLAKLREKYANDPAVRERHRVYHLKHREKYLSEDLTKQAVKRAVRDGREASITAEFVRAMWEASPTCKYCGVALVQGVGKAEYHSPSLDRIDPSLGYTEQNTVLACWRCNSLKRDATADEIEALAVNFRRVSAARQV